jgi:Protein of unknown function (DUF3122)
MTVIRAADRPNGKRAMKRLFLFFLVLWSFLLFIVCELDYSLSALALTRQQEESAGQMLYQSRHSLRDEIGSPWQVVLFKRVKEGEVKDLNLRLVGFPEGIAFRHPEALAIAISGGEIFLALDVFADGSPAPNVGEYEMEKILSRLPLAGEIKLSLPLDKTRRLTIPSPVLLEWQTSIAPSWPQEVKF